MNNDYTTIKDFASDKFIEKKSEFIGSVSPVKTVDEAFSFIEKIKSENRKATHNVYAYILRNGSLSGYSDDGEPQGTAGVPVIEVLKHKGLTDICCVVTRYFGGILLGTGGLVRAYSHSAVIACEAAEIMEMKMCYPVEFSVDYNLYGKVNFILPSLEAKIISTDFSDNVKIKLLIKEGLYEEFSRKIADVSCGTARIKKGELSFENFL